MNYPLDKTQFIAWAKAQGPDELVDLKLLLLRDETDLEVQLQNNPTASSWVARAETKLRHVKWRLQIIATLLEHNHNPQHNCHFQEVARQLLDHDTYITLLEAADAARVS